MCVKYNITQHNACVCIRTYIHSKNLAHKTKKKDLLRLLKLLKILNHVQRIL